jgi:hypothetical protein
MTSVLRPGAEANYIPWREAARILLLFQPERARPNPMTRLVARSRSRTRALVHAAL